MSNQRKSAPANLNKTRPTIEGAEFVARLLPAQSKGVTTGATLIKAGEKIEVAPKTTMRLLQLECPDMTTTFENTGVIYGPAWVQEIPYIARDEYLRLRQDRRKANLRKTEVFLWLLFLLSAALAVGLYAPLLFVPMCLGLVGLVLFYHFRKYFMDKPGFLQTVGRDGARGVFPLDAFEYKMHFVNYPKS